MLCKFAAMNWITILFNKATYLFYCLLIFSGLSAFAQVDVTTPQASVINHLSNLQEEQYYPERSVQSFRFDKQTSSEKRKLAVKLKQIYDGLGEYIDVELIPDERNFKDSLSGRTRYYILETNRDIYLEKYEGKWLYSASTVAKINKIHHEVFPMGASFLMRFIPADQGDKYLGIYTWQWIGIGVLLAICTLLFFLLRFLIGILLVQGVERLGSEHVGRKLLRPGSGPASGLITVLFFKLFYSSLLLPVQVNHTMVIALKIIIPVMVLLMMYRLVDLLGIYLVRMADKTESKLDDQLVPLLNKTLKVFVVIIGLVFILQNLDFNVTGILAGLSIGGLAFAFAAQDTIKNFLGSIMIFLDKPFQIGDWITGDGFDGVVEEVGFRSTRVRSFRDSLMYVPNSKIADMITDNHGKRRYRRFSTVIGITYDTPPRVINQFVKGLRGIVDNHPRTVKENYHVYLNEFGANSLQILFYVYFEVPDWSKELEERHEIMISVMELSEALGVRFAFPTQTIHVEEFPGTTSLTPIHKLSDQEMEQKIKEVVQRNK